MLSCSCLYVLEQGENSQLCAIISTLDKKKIQRDMKKPAGYVCHFAKKKKTYFASSSKGDVLDVIRLYELVHCVS